MKTWTGPVPREDDFGVIITDRFVDGKTVLGPWAIMSMQSFQAFGTGLGEGRGQLYVKRNGDAWEKV